MFKKLDRKNLNIENHRQWSFAPEVDDYKFIA